MSGRRRKAGFERLGQTSVRGEQLPRRLEIELQLVDRWRRVAGEAVARRARVLGIKRGTLEVFLEPGQGAEGSWEAVLDEYVPQLAARLAEQHPDLGIRRVRLLREGERETPPSRKLPDPLPAELSALSASSVDPPQAPVRKAPLPVSQRLEALADAYLSRGRRGIDGTDA